MKQAIQEGFILDVLKYYTPIDRFYRLKKTVEDDPLFDKKKAQKKLRAFVESQAFTIAEKADMMVSHFHEQVIAKGKIGGQARAMIITSSIERCIEYYHLRCLRNRGSAAEVHEQSAAGYGVGIFPPSAVTFGFQNAVCRDDLGACAGYAGSISDKPL